MRALSALQLDNSRLSTIPASLGELADLTLLELNGNPLPSVPPEVLALVRDENPLTEYNLPTAQEVIRGLYIGGLGAAGNLPFLRLCRVTHILNLAASPNKIHVGESKAPGDLPSQRLSSGPPPPQYTALAEADRQKLRKAVVQAGQIHDDATFRGRSVVEDVAPILQQLGVAEATPVVAWVAARLLQPHDDDADATPRGGTSASSRNESTGAEAEVLRNMRFPDLFTYCNVNVADKNSAQVQPRPPLSRCAYAPRRAVSRAAPNGGAPAPMLDVSFLLWGRAMAAQWRLTGLLAAALCRRSVPPLLVLWQLDEHFTTCIQFIAKAIEAGGVVLCHCHRGVSRRSVSLI